MVPLYGLLPSFKGSELWGPVLKVAHNDAIMDYSAILHCATRQDIIPYHRLYYTILFPQGK